MNPGATTLPAASIVRLRGAAARLPMVAIFPSRMPTSPAYHGEPVPSMMWPWVITRSKSGVCAGREVVANSKWKVDNKIEIDRNEINAFTVGCLSERIDCLTWELPRSCPDLIYFYCDIEVVPFPIILERLRTVAAPVPSAIHIARASHS